MGDLFGFNVPNSFMNWVDQFKSLYTGSEELITISGKFESFVGVKSVTSDKILDDLNAYLHEKCRFSVDFYDVYDIS